MQKPPVELPGALPYRVKVYSALRAITGNYIPLELFFDFFAFLAFFAFFFLAFVVMLFRLVGVEVTAANTGAPSESAKPRVHSRVNSFFIVRFEPPLKLEYP
jgi:hypothetical protein